MIVLNEVALAKNILSNGEVGDKPSFTLRLLARYYYHIENKSIDEIISELDTFMKLYYPNYESALWENNIDKYGRQAEKCNIRQLEYIEITKNELSFIANVENEIYQKLLFVMLCYSKFYNKLSVNNNNWVNIPIYEIFKSARVNVRYAKDKMIVMHDLREYINKNCIIKYDDNGNDITEYIMKFAKKNDSLNIQLNIVDNQSEIILKIDDLRELGYRYLLYKGENIKDCDECGILFKQNRNKTLKYCSKHRGYHPIGYKKILCIDCGKEVKVDAKDNETCRCEECYKIYRRNKVKENVKKYRERQKNQNM